MGITKSSNNSDMLVRKYIGRKLAEYYAQPSHKVVGRSIDLEASKANNNNGQLLSSLMGEWHWKRVFQKIYEEREGHWLTPVELFQPHYSYVLGDFCAHCYDRMEKNNRTNSKNNDKENNRNTNTHCNSTKQFEIVELGGGRGTNANWILSYLREHKPHVYSSLISYTLVDSSPSLHQTQKERFLGGPHADKVRFELKDLSDVAQGTVQLLSKSEIPTVLMGMEVLDNLPHDKVRGTVRHKLEQAEVVVPQNNSKQKQQQLREKFVPLNDPLLKIILQKVPSYYTQQQQQFLQTDACWVPSIACGVVHHAINQRNNLGLVFADFDWLPPPDLDPSTSLDDEQDHDFSSSSSSKNKNKQSIVDEETPAGGSPIVTDMEGKDHKSYLSAPGHCDILFPTNFEKLAAFAKRCLPPTGAATRTVRRPVQVIRVEKQSHFLERVGPEHVAKTRSWLTGHTPLLYDFANCSVLTISPDEGTRHEMGQEKE